MHNELQTCGKWWNLSEDNISVILICVFGHQGASICIKIGKKSKYHLAVHNLHIQWIAILWQIMKSIRVQHFSQIDFGIWPPGGSNMSKKWGKVIISLFLFIIYIDNDLQTCGQSWILSGYNIAVILISVFGHLGAATSLKMGRNHIIVPVDNLGLHTQWIAIL